ncbi:DUF1269 domain-containing protein [Dietzia sp. ANT_WB102]|nr:DUF1269 domain-containing protein [Dietzia sp. ANT_WB102]
MAGTLTVWKFNTDTGADTAVETLKNLQQQELITVHDAAVVRWAEGAKKPKTRQLNNLAGVGALGGTFWGLLFGILFFVPLLGAAIGAGIGALSGSLSDVGIDDNFINQLKEKITPGTSALFVLTSDAKMDRVHDEFKSLHAELLSTNLSHDQEAALREAFAE